MEQPLQDVFKLANDYIRKQKLEIEELEKEKTKKLEKVKSLQKALIIIEEHCKYK